MLERKQEESKGKWWEGKREMGCGISEGRSWDTEGTQRGKCNLCVLLRQLGPTRELQANHTDRTEKQGTAAGDLRRKVAWFLVWFLFTLQGSNLEMIPSKLKVLLKNCKILPLSGETHVFVRMHFSEFWLSCSIWEFPGHLSGFLFSLWPDLPLKAKTSPINLWTPFRLYTMSCI